MVSVGGNVMVNEGVSSVATVKVYFDKQEQFCLFRQPCKSELMIQRTN